MTKGLEAVVAAIEYPQRETKMHSKEDEEPKFDHAGQAGQPELKAENDEAEIAKMIESWGIKKGRSYEDGWANALGWAIRELRADDRNDAADYLETIKDA
jgi:hypothetical protein